MSVSPKLISTSPATTHPYLWVVGDDMNGRAIAQLSPGTMVGDRFQVISSQMWVDHHPERELDREMEWPASVSPYLKLYGHRLHLPEVYGIYTPSEEPFPKEMPNEERKPIVLLTNIPVDANGALLPTLESMWTAANPVRQLSWLWQIGQLWTVLESQGVAASLLHPDNIHVDGWRVRLRELLNDSSLEPEMASLKALGSVWINWAETADASVQSILLSIGEELQNPDASWSAVAPRLNTALVQQAAHYPLLVDSAGSTSAGDGRTLNEDTCYPLTLSLNGVAIDEADELQPRVAIVCDGMCGHSGGEVASQLTVRALKLQLRALFADLASEPTPLSPDIVMRQIEAAIRVVNNLVAFQNNEQNRHDRHRMGTTLVMALQVPQQVMTPAGSANTHELYLAHVGDSRAYWLTPNGCHCLTVDDDVKSREVIEGRSLPREAERRSDAIALTQALGTRKGEYLHIKLQRFMIDEDGVLLLCSDGLSDGGLIERYWQSMARNVLRGQLSLNKAVGIWLKLANQHNGHDNASVVLMRCRTSAESVQMFEPSHASSASSSSSRLTPIPASASNQDEALNEVSHQPSVQRHPTWQNRFDTSSEHQGNEDRTASPTNFAAFQLADLSPEQMDSISSDPAFQSVGDSADFEALARTLLGASAPSEPDIEPDEPESSGLGVFLVAVCLSIVMFALGAGGVFAWRRYAPSNFNEAVDQAIETLSEYLPFMESFDKESPEDTQE
ncbi:MAG: protein phosphatase 2C domain-containing protein [Leptolyngbyaceae bacterium]|nr:protein phosphatase 2C domain-containing protein [Leptolyngbyaceae bacterium]